MIETIARPVSDDCFAWHDGVPPEEDWPPPEWEFDPGPDPLLIELTALGLECCYPWVGADVPEHDHTPRVVADAQLDCSELALWGARLAAGPLPREEAALIDLLRAAEDLKSAAAALQAKAAVAFETARRQAEADRGLAASKRGAGISTELGLARRESPHRASRLLGLARALVGELPHTLQALTEGVLNEWRATLVARETACLDPGDRALVDAWLATHLAGHPGVGDHRLVAEVRRKVIEIDQHAVVNRRAAAAGGRRVGLQPLPDGQVRLTAILGLTEGVAVYAALKQAADQHTGSPDATGQPRGRGAVMADTLVERVTANPASDPLGLNLTVVITDQALLSATDEPAHVDGYGPMPARWVRQLIAQTTDSAHRSTLRRLFRGPGRTVQLETNSRRMTPALRHLIALRDQHCRTPWCSAPIRHADHVHPHTDGGPTSLLNGQGLCEACNYTKQTPGWHSTPHHDPAHGHTVTTTTPTGHIYQSTPPTSPGEE